MGKQKKVFLIVRIIGSTVNVIASGVAIAGVVAAPFTGGASLIPAYVAGTATAIAWVGNMTSALASLIEHVLETEGVNVRDSLLLILKATDLSPAERLELVSEFFKELIRAIEGAGTATAAGATGQAVNTADRLQNMRRITEIIDYAQNSPLVKLNGLSLLFGLIDAITASVQLYNMRDSP